MKRIFVDTNVLFDVLCQRDPFYNSSATVWTLCEKGKVEGYISAISFNIVYYVLRRQSSSRVAKSKVVLLRDVFRIAAMDEQVVHQAIDSDFSDFEDAIQYFSAVRIDAQNIVTNNKKDFKLSGLPVLSPDEFLNLMSVDE